MATHVAQPLAKVVEAVLAGASPWATGLLSAAVGCLLTFGWNQLGKFWEKRSEKKGKKENMEEGEKRKMEEDEKGNEKGNEEDKIEEEKDKMGEDKKKEEDENKDEAPHMHGSLIDCCLVLACMCGLYPHHNRFLSEDMDRKYGKEESLRI